MSEQLTHLIEEQNRAFHQFKRANDERLAQIEAKGHADPLLERRVDRTNATLAELEVKLRDLEKQVGRGFLAGGPGDQDAGERIKGGSRVEISPRVKSAFAQFLRTGDASALDIGGKAMNTITGSDGGFVVPEQLDLALNAYLYDSSVMRQLARTVQSFTADYKVVRSTGVATSAWVGETDERPETDTPSLVQMAVPVGELYAAPAITQTLLDDAGFDVTAWLLAEVQGRFASQEGIAFFTGNGVNKPKGFLDNPTAATADSTRPFGTIQHKLAASATALDLDELIDVTTDLRGPYRAGAVWLMNAKTAAAARKLKSATDELYLWQPSIMAGQPPTLHGYPVRIDENMPDIAASAAPIAFGNFNMGYTIVDRSAWRLLVDPYTRKPFVSYYCTKRVGGMLTDSNAIKLLKMKDS